ncbi:MAG: hypothetical protein ABF335_07460 [Alphaproteobacteria bacterium]
MKKRTERASKNTRRTNETDDQYFSRMLYGEGKSVIDRAKEIGQKVRYQAAKKIGQTINAVEGSTGAAGDFAQNFIDMREANTVDADKYFHCKANCEATMRGPWGEKTAKELGDWRELYGRIKGDPPSDEAADQRANQDGRNGAKKYPSKSCSGICQKHRPNVLDPRS